MTVHAHEPPAARALPDRRDAPVARRRGPALAAGGWLARPAIRRRPRRGIGRRRRDGPRSCSRRWRCWAPSVRPVAVATFISLMPGPPGPVAARADRAAGAVGRVRPDRQDRARPLRPVQPRGRHLRRDPAGPGGRDDRRRGPHASGRTPASTPSGILVGRRWTPSAAGPAAPPRSPSSSSASACSTPNGTAQTQLSVDAQAQGDHPVDPVTQAFPGEEGKQRIMAAYLNQNYYGNESYGVAAAAKSYFGVAAEGPDPRPGRDPRRDPQGARPATTSSRTPSRSASIPSRRPRTPARARSWWSRPTPRSSSAATWSWT